MPSKDPSTPDELQGRVVQMTEENGKVRIVVDAGVWIALLISKKHYQKIGLMVGETIVLSIPPEAIHLM
jgi:ABC-type molybdate transport system ATPase subunit